MYFKGPNKKFTSSKVNKIVQGIDDSTVLFFRILSNPNLIVSK